MKVTKWSINSGGLNVSAQSETQQATKAEVAIAASEVGMTDAPAIAPDHEAPKADAPKAEAPVEAPKAEAPKVEAPRVEPAKAGAPGTAGKLLIMAPGERGAKTEAAQAPGKRRFAAMAAMVALATLAGAAGGTIGTIGVMHKADAAAPAPASNALE